jgi:hypothetical protein
MISKITPIFILGAAHSGTTILYRMLAMHPDVTWFSQFSQRGGNIPGRFRIPFHNQLDWFLRFLLPHDWQKGEGSLRRLFVPRPGEANRIWGYIVPEDRAVPSQESIGRMRQIFELECKFWRKSYIITKLPRLYKHIPLLQTAYPQAKFIHILRDGRAVALSDKHKFMRHGESEMEGLHAAARYWLNVVTEVNKRKRGVDLLELRYEDFCADVHGFIREILLFIGLESAKFPVSKCPATLKVTNPKTGSS